VRRHEHGAQTWGARFGIVGPPRRAQTFPPAKTSLLPSPTLAQVEGLDNIVFQLRLDPKSAHHGGRTSDTRTPGSHESCDKLFTKATRVRGRADRPIRWDSESKGDSGRFGPPDRRLGSGHVMFT